MSTQMKSFSCNFPFFTINDIMIWFVSYMLHGQNVKTKGNHVSHPQVINGNNRNYKANGKEDDI
jgi:hypothetical protein